MRKLAEKYTVNWVLLAAIPTANIAMPFLRLLGANDTWVTAVGITLLAFQLFGLFMVIRYYKIIFK